MADVDPATTLIGMLDLYQRPMIGAMARLGIADLLAGGPQAAEGLAAQVGADPAALYRLMRALSTRGLLEHLPDDTFALTQVGALLQRDVPGSLHSMAVYFSDPAYGAAANNLLHSVRTGLPAFDAVHGAPFFPYMSGHPELAAAFNAFMSSGANPGMAGDRHGAVAQAYDFSSAGLVVDVGGAHGALLMAILRHYPQTHGLLFEIPSVVAAAAAGIAGSGLADRISTEAGTFFERVPGGGDIYLLSLILHDWPDERCLAILRNVRQAMGPESRMLVMERVLPAPDDAERLTAADAYQDLNMMVIAGGRERTRAEFQALFQQAGLELQRVLDTGTAIRIIEARPVA